MYLSTLFFLTKFLYNYYKPFFTGVIKKKTRIAQETFELEFSIKDTGFVFHPGQYVWVILPHLAVADPKGSRRAFSIISSAREPHTIQILYRNSESGFKQTLLGLEIGAEVTLSGPYGSSFAIDEAVGQEVVFVAGGVGIAPFLSILRSFSLLSHKPKITVFYGNSSKEKECYGELLEQLCADSGSTLMRKTERFSTELFSAEQLQKAVWFVCGPAGMVTDVASKLHVANVPQNKMRFEQFYPDESIYA